MVDNVKDDKTVDTKPVEIKETEVKPEVDKKTEPEYQDNNAMSEIQKQIDEMKIQNKQIAQKAQQYDKITEAVTGQPDRVKTDEKFFRDFADNPEETLANFLKTHTDKEVTELKEKMEKKEVSDANAMSVQYFMQNDPDYEEVTDFMQKNIPREDFEKYMNKKDGFDVLYSRAKTRMNIMNIDKKAKEGKATVDAKNIDNKKSVSEVPSGGGELPGEGNKKLRDLLKAKEDFDSEKVEQILADDIWHIGGQNI